MKTVLNQIEHHLAQHLLSEKGWAQYQQGNVSKAELARFIDAIKDLSIAYTRHSVGDTFGNVVVSELAAAAYALYYLPINAAKILHLLPLLPTRKPFLRVLDFGCGPGTMPIALLASSSSDIEFTCIEHSTAMRHVAHSLISSWHRSHGKTTVEYRTKLSDKRDETFDIICAANSLAELKEAALEKTAIQLLSHLAPGGTLLLLEPGQLLHTRRLMALRDSLLVHDPGLIPLFPCTRSDACPMLKASDEDWCHGTLEWQQPKLNTQLDDMLGFNKHRIKYSAFVFTKDKPLPVGYRVIIPAQKEARGIEATLCGNDFYGTVQIKKGERSAQTKALEKSQCFDRLVTDLPLASTKGSSTCFSNEGPL